MPSRASYSRVFYEPYDIDTGEAVGEPTDYTSACRAALASLRDCSVRWHHAERLTDRVRPVTDAETEATIAWFNSPFPKRGRDFFDDEISRAIRTTEEIGPA